MIRSNAWQLLKKKAVADANALQKYMKHKTGSPISISAICTF
jgi:hypothetical protein